MCIRDSNNTGHFPYAYDFNGDGKDEIFSCYNMISSDGKLQWELPIDTDHTDEIVIGKFDPDIDEELLAIVSGWEGFMIVDKHGHILAREINGHVQRISVANYCPNMRGLQKMCIRDRQLEPASITGLVVTSANGIPTVLSLDTLEERGITLNTA